MGEIREDGTSFTGYEYKEIPAGGDLASMRLDCYQSFGWTLDERTPEQALRGRGKLVLKRDRNIINKMELTRLQRHFESCMRELDELEQSRTSRATICSVTVGLLGCAFLAGATFAAVHEPPLISLTILLALPGFLLWSIPIFLYRAMVRRRSKVVDRLMEQKYDEIYEICEKGHHLLV